MKFDVNFGLGRIRTFDRVISELTAFMQPKK